MTDFADITMRLEANGMGEVLVNGEDITGRIVGMGLQFRPGQPLVVNVQQLAGSVTLVGQGIVQIAQPGENKEAIRTFFDHLDPMTVEEEVLRRGSLDQGLIATAVEIMREQIDGVR